MLEWINNSKWEYAFQVPPQPKPKYDPLPFNVTITKLMIWVNEYELY